MPDRAADDLPDLQSLWDYGDPAGTRAVFLEVLPRIAEAPAGVRSEWMTQVARTFSLEGAFDDARKWLNDAEACAEPGASRSEVRLRLERGRTDNSAGEKVRARGFFLEAWELACEGGHDGLAVDAAHMVAIVETPDEAIRWNELALELARSSDDPDARRWVGSLANNMGWTYHDGRKDFATALEWFDIALAAREELGKTREILIARWCRAKCLRSLGRVDEALVIQRELEAIHREAGTPDGYVAEEIGECLLALGDAAAAAPWFAKAWTVLSADAWLVEHEADRLNRIKALADAP